jgi:hypothetical protein
MCDIGELVAILHNLLALWDGDGGMMGSNMAAHLAGYNGKRA